MGIRVRAGGSFGYGPIKLTLQLNYLPDSYVALNCVYEHVKLLQRAPTVTSL